MATNSIEESAAAELDQHRYHYLSHLCSCQVGDQGARMNVDEHPAHLAHVLAEKGLLREGSRPEGT